MTTFSAEARFELKGARAVIDDMCEHLRSHGVAIDRSGDRTVLTLYHGTSEIAVEGDNALLKVEAPSLTGIAVLTETLASHFIEHFPDLADRIVWSGAAGEPAHPVWFCLLTVVGTRRLTPHMQRITFEGSDLGRYSGFGDIHMRLMFPRDDDGAPQWPRVSPNGVTQYPPEDTLAIRKYTYRRIDVAAGTLDVDFVLHEDAGPGSDFAFRAKPGTVIGMGGPGGRCAPPDRDWYLLAGDETALPAIARILETLPRTARGVALIEVADAAEEQPIINRTGIDIRWLHRDDAAPGTTTLLIDAVRAVEFPSDGSSVFAWGGCEFAAFKAIRSYARNERMLKKDESLIVSYWQRADTEDAENEHDH
ncbi:siderophore-interacting protein [Mesorhizobium sp. SB112]|uniref:siderophore-interacting protein n=1 Tax=Mesorhizobium sp. SB112 TaxID=3151853 RepID=UPI0032642EEB